MIRRYTFPDRELWLEARKGRIGGSDASAIVGRNPYMSNTDLWEIKTGRREQEDISDRPYVVYGTKAEEYLRELFRLDFPEYDVRYEEGNMFINDRFPWAHASLDGWLVEKDTGRRGVLEIKTTNILQSMQKEKWKDGIPDNYFCQVLHYLMVTEADFAILKAQLKYDFKGELPYMQVRHYLIERAEVEEDITFLEKEEKRFWEHLQRNIRPATVLPEI
ncbi:MAG: recombinase [Sarcina sp.]|nr:recombinase [Sarcina sp.]